MLKEIEEATDGQINATTLGLNDAVSYKITQRTLHFNIDTGSAFLMGNMDGGVILGSAGVIAGVVTSTTVATALGIAIVFAPIIVRHFVFYGIPQLEEGKYTVYDIDITISRTSYMNGASGQRGVVETHCTKQVYVLTSPSGDIYNYVVSPSGCYYIDDRGN